MHARRLLTAALGLATGLSIAIPGVAANARDHAEGAFLKTNLVSDIPGMAPVTDPNLINPWGISAGPTSPMWVSDNNGDGQGHGQASTLYNGAGQPLGLVVKIPQPNSPDGGAPTGQVFNGSTDFEGAPFIFATEDGTIAAWEPMVDVHHAQIEVDQSIIPTADTGAVYKGLAIGKNRSGNHLYAANFRAGTIDVFDANFTPVHLSGSFTDNQLPPEFSPFNIQNIGNKLYVTYALPKAGRHDDMAGPGNGFVDVFDLNGHLLRRLVKHGALNSPWGLALAPDNFGPFSGALLVGNFGDGRINAYSPRSGRFIGTLRDETGAPIHTDGLWGIRFGNGSTGGGALAPTNTLYFAAGIAEEQHGLFGKITSVGENGN